MNARHVRCGRPKRSPYNGTYEYVGIILISQRFNTLIFWYSILLLIRPDPVKIAIFEEGRPYFCVVELDLMSSCHTVPWMGDQGVYLHRTTYMTNAGRGVRPCRKATALLSVLPEP
jgi:hypothetical protein